MSLVKWDDDAKEESYDNQFPLMPHIAPSIDHPLDPHNDLLPPAYAMPLAHMNGGPPEILNKRYFSLTVDDIQQFQRNKLKKWIKVYEKVLGMCFRRIRDHVIHDQNYCLFIIPEFIPGFPVYNMTHCTAFIVRKLRIARFRVQYTPPNVLVIFWDADKRERQRTEMKKVVERPREEQQDEKDVHYVSLKTNEQSLPFQTPKKTINQRNSKSSYYGSQKEEPFLFT